MDKKKRVGFQSALLVSVGVIAGSFAASLLAWWVHADAVAALLLAVSVVGLVSRLWGLYALRRLETEVRADRETLSVGQELRMHYTIRNNKALPLIWLELCQDVPRRDCLVPGEGFERLRFSEEEAAHAGREEVWRRRFSFLMGFKELEWDCCWTGQRRGVYRPGDLVLRSGDGFGLTQSTAATGGFGGQVFVVWPKIVPVRTAPFLRNIWTGHTGQAGWVEDPSVLRGERAYQPGDPWKRIDWRTAARTDELYVRQYETLRPMSILFLLDSAELEDAEEGISLTASLIRHLSLEGIRCGLALPQTAERPALLLRPDDPAVTAERCLFALAEFDAEGARAGAFDRRALVSAAPEAGQLWLLGQESRSLRTGAAAQALERSGLRLLCKVPGQGALSFADVMGKEAAQ